MKNLLVAIVVLLSAGFVSGQSCTSSSEFFYRNGALCESGGFQGCSYSMGFDPYPPPGGSRYLMMATGYDLNVYKVTSAGTAPALVQRNALSFAVLYRSIGKVLFRVSIDPFTGYGLAPYLESGTQAALPSRIFRADPATGRVTELLKFGADVANGQGVMGMTPWGIAFSLPGQSGTRVPFVGYNESPTIFYPQNGTLKIRRFDPVTKTLSTPVADLGVFLRQFVVIRHTSSVTIIGLQENARHQSVTLRVFRVTLGAGDVMQVTALPGVAPGSSSNRFFTGVVVDEMNGLVIAGSNGTQGAIEAWDVPSSGSPVFLGAAVVPGLWFLRPVAAGGGWVTAGANSGSDRLFSFLDPANPTEVPTAPFFPQENPPKYGTSSILGGAMIADSQGVWAFASSHLWYGSWTRLSPGCLGGVVWTPTPTPVPPGPTVTPAPPGPCPTCPACPPGGATPTPAPQATPTRTPTPTRPPTSSWYCHNGDQCSPGEPNPFGLPGCPGFPWVANHEPCPLRRQW